MNNVLGYAIAIAAGSFVNKKDKGGQPYILHCLHVMNQMPEDDHELRCIAVLHDLLEDDPDWSPQKLWEHGFESRVIDGIIALTHKDGESYDDYIKRISLNPDAKRVKVADLKHNSDITRMKGLSKKDFDRLEKYHRSYAYLKD